MEKRHYVMLLNDPAQPGFCSKDKPYFGTIEHFIMVKWLMEGYTGWEATATAIGKYFLGQKPAEHYIAHKFVPILKRIKVFASENLRFEDKTWEHFNIWGFTYKMRCDSGFAIQIIVSMKGNTVGVFAFGLRTCAMKTQVVHGIMWIVFGAIRS